MFLCCCQYLYSARGLDIPSIRTVVNYDVARDIDTHTHRIGRTGRAGEKGVAYTLLTNKDHTFAGDLVRNLEGANQAVSKELMDLAMQVIMHFYSKYNFVLCGRQSFVEIMLSSVHSFS